MFSLNNSKIPGDNPTNPTRPAVSLPLLLLEGLSVGKDHKVPSSSSNEEIYLMFLSIPVPARPAAYCPFPTPSLTPKIKKKLSKRAGVSPMLIDSSCTCKFRQNK